MTWSRRSMELLSRAQFTKYNKNVKHDFYNVIETGGGVIFS